MTTKILDVSIVIVSFNTRDLLRECLQILAKYVDNVHYETLVIDNASCDGSAAMVAQTFPDVKLIRSEVNLGFAAANNLGFKQAAGRYVVLLNSDAFITPQALTYAVTYMQQCPEVGLAGARLTGKRGEWQPSARMFPSLLRHFLTLSGLATKYPNSRFFGQFDRTWADPDEIAEVDWVPGAFSIIRRDVLQQVGYFDENFFLYYEEVDLCRRIQLAGYHIIYLPQVMVIHLGGESSKTLNLEISSKGAQVALWQLRSALLFFRKHYGGLSTWLWWQLENNWHLLREWKNARSTAPECQSKANYSKNWRNLLKQAWQDTKGGKISPPRPW
jgi:GT2 family glycosyltransferase